MIQAVIFDLDDTLYLESDFVASGYREVARHIARKYGCSFRDVFHTMMSVFVTHGRENVLPVIVRRYLGDGVPLSEFVEVYRNHSPRIHLFPGYPGLLRRLRNSYKLGIITDGHPEVQKRKVHSLGLERMIDRIIYTWEYGMDMQKPHPQPFMMMMNCLQTRPDSTLFVGDNTEKDCKGAHGVGMKYVHVPVQASVGCKSEPLSADKADYVLDSLYQLPRILQGVEGT